MFGGKPHYSVGHVAKHYAAIMRQSLFCLAPKGIGTFTGRLFEVRWVAVFKGILRYLLRDYGFWLLVDAYENVDE